MTTLGKRQLGKLAGVGGIESVSLRRIGAKQAVLGPPCASSTLQRKSSAAGRKCGGYAR